MPTVSRETSLKFETYFQLLQKWQKTINLVSAETVNEAMERHIADSAQLAALIPDTAQTLMDWGSGGGFPGLVLAIQHPDLAVHLVESDERKCAFLRTVSRETKSHVKIHPARIESIDPASIQPDIITARALAALPKLLEYGLPWAERYPNLQFLFMKGERADQEITSARQKFSFALETIPSKTDANASILRICRLCIN